MQFCETSGFLDLFLFIAILLCIFVCFYFRQLNDQRVRRPEFDNKTVLVVTAHPDDECMFFSPTILNLKGFSTIHLLCLSTGINKIKNNKKTKQMSKKTCFSFHFNCIEFYCLPLPINFASTPPLFYFRKSLWTGEDKERGISGKLCYPWNYTQSCDCHRLQVNQPQLHKISISSSFDQFKNILYCEAFLVRKVFV